LVQVAFLPVGGKFLILLDFVVWLVCPNRPRILRQAQDKFFTNTRRNGPDAGIRGPIRGWFVTKPQIPPESGKFKRQFINVKLSRGGPEKRFVILIFPGELRVFCGS
jgi:hypothetical protein